MENNTQAAATETTATATTISDKVEDTASNAGIDTKTYSQVEIDQIVTSRLKRERSKWEETLKTEREMAAMSESEKLKAEKDAATKRADDILHVANQRVIAAEAKAKALAMGVKPERLNYALKLADLAGVEISDDGGVDDIAIETAIKQVITDLPELIASPSAARAGGDFRAGIGPAEDPAAMTMEQYASWRKANK